MEEWEAEHRVLNSETGRRLMEIVSHVEAPGPAELSRWRRIAPADEVAAAVRLAGARRRAVTKFERAASMWLDTKGLEQATAEPVARHKAVRFAGQGVVDLCCGIGGDTLALAAASSVLAIDADAGMCRRTLWNARTYGVGADVAAVRARAQRFPRPGGLLVHVDPDRRARSATRARVLEEYVPGVEFLHRLILESRGGAVKLSPASDFDNHFDRAKTETELISLRGECKEATVWFGELVTCRRRATVLPAKVTWSDHDGPADRSTPIRPVSNWIYDPDPALSRSRLVDSFAIAHDLARCSSGIDFLTSDTLIRSAFLAPFEVHELLPLDLKTLRRRVAERGLGPLEIKVRGLDLRPEALRKELRPRGPNPATLVLMGGQGPARAVVARRVVGCDETP